MEIELSNNNAITSEGVRRFVTKYHFVRQVRGSSNFKVFQALDAATGNSVSIWISKLSSKASFGSFVEFLSKGFIFPHVYHFETIDRTSILVSEYLDPESVLSNSSLTFSVNNIRRILFQLIDCLEYLFDNHICHGKILPESIFIDKKVNIKLSNYEEAFVYDEEMSDKCRRKDMVGVGKVVLWIIYRCEVSEDEITVRVSEINDSLLRDTLGYIFSTGSPPDIITLCSIAKAKMSPKKMCRNVVFADPVIVEQLSFIGISKNHLLTRVNDKSKKEYYLYRLYETKLIDEIYKSKNDRVGEDDLYECLRRRRYIIEKRRSLLERQLEETCVSLRCVFKRQILLNLLSPEDYDHKSRVISSLCEKNLEWKGKVFVFMDSHELNVTIEHPGPNLVAITLNYGNLEKFVEFVENFIEGFRWICED